MLPVRQASSVGVQSLLGAALHVQTLVAEEVAVLREAFDTVAALEGPCLVLHMRAAAVARQVLGPLERLPALAALAAELGRSLGQQPAGPRSRSSCLSLLRRLQSPGLQVDAPVRQQV